MMEYLYLESGLDNVIIEGIGVVVDDAGEESVTIPNINGLHRAIALAILRKHSAVSGKELRFLRTEIGLTQAELAGIVHKEPLTISRWERGEQTIEPNAEAVLRLYAAKKLELDLGADIDVISGWCITRAETPPLRIDGTSPGHYVPIAA